MPIRALSDESICNSFRFSAAILQYGIIPADREDYARHSRPLLSDFLLSSSLDFALIIYPIAGDTTRNEATNDVEQFT